MFTIITILITVLHIFLLVWAFKLANRSKWFSLSNVLILVIAGLIYDNGVIAAGKYIGESNLLEQLNIIRFWLHALFTPTLILFSLYIFRHIGRGFRKTWLTLLAYFLTIALIIYEILTSVITIELKASWEKDVLSYVPASEDPSPIMVIAVTICLLIAAVILYRREKWPWMLIGVLAVACGSAVNIWLNITPIMNFFEWVLLLSLVLAKRFIHLRKSEI